MDGLFAGFIEEAIGHGVPISDAVADSKNYTKYCVAPRFVSSIRHLRRAKRRLRRMVGVGMVAGMSRGGDAARGVPR
jgi:hypothetical protein